MVVKRAIHALAESRAFTRWIGRRGMQWGFAERFVAGETLDEALSAIRELNALGMFTTLDYLGESVTDAEATRQAARTYCRILDTIADEEIGASISVKLSQLGLDIGTDLAGDNLRTIVARARDHGNFVRVDMEDSDKTERTLEIFKALRPEYPNLGVCLQSYLRRTEDDVRQLNAMEAQIRLCKGAYQEPPEVAYQSREEVDESFFRLGKLLLDEGTYPAFATHDDRLVDRLCRYAAEREIGAGRFEFQMLYGVRRRYQVQIVRGGYHMRVYVPFGTEWCPYFMRRIAERPANALFVMRAILGG